MQCPRCQHENPPRAKFCEECATPLARTCPNCGSQVSASSKFCPECAHPLAGPTPAQPRFTSPETYTPKHLAEKILISKSALEGERKQVTVLFADLKGSMELLADRDPEEARQLLDPVLERMMEAVHRYEGTVNQVMGDGIMALFGAPLAHEDHAVRACYAALDMQAAIRRYAEEVRRVHGVSLEIRVGLNSGEVVVRAIGSDLHMDYTAVGQTTHLAARMEQLASPGRTLLTAETLRLTEGYIEVKPLGPVSVKGLDTPVEVYEMTGAGTLRSRLHAAVARGLTRFVGREHELEQLRHALGRAASGHGEVVTVIGEPGVGKSRLVWEVTHSHQTRDWLILQASSVSYGKATPYFPVIGLLKGYFYIEDRDDQRKVREKVVGKLLALDRALEPVLAAFLALLDVPVEESQWQALDPPQRRQRTLDAVKRLLLRESQVQPVLVVFEDLHWIDSETQALLDSLVESLPITRILLLVNYRPEYEHRWGSKTYYTQLRLDPLPAESAEQLLRALLGDDASLEPVKRLLIERTEGNPFFLEESVRTLVETGVLVGDRGACRLTKTVESIQVPATVQAVLAARIDRLPPGEKRLLQSASVVGKDVPFALLQATAELPEDELRHGLAHLKAAEFLYETSLFPELEYTFKHALTCEVAYGSLLQDRRRALHARIVGVIERLNADRLAEQIEDLAHHAYRAEDWGKAVLYLRQAGTKAAARSAHREAVACFEQALTALQHLPATRDVVEQAIDLRLDLRNSLIPLGEVGRILEHLREAEALARSLKDQRRQGRVLCFLSSCFWVMGDYIPARESAQRTRVLAVELGDASLLVYANVALSWTYHSLGDYREGVRFGAEAVEFLQGHLIWEHFGVPSLPAVNARTWLASCLAELGEFEQGIVRGEEAVRLAEAIQEPWSLVAAFLGLGVVRLRKGEVDEAIRVLARGLDVCRRFDIHVWFPSLASSLGYALALSGAIPEGIPLLTRAVEQATSTRLRFYHSLATAWLSEAQLLAGRPEEARAIATDALELCRRNQEAGCEAHVLRLLGDIGARGAPPGADQAEAYYRQALERATRLDMRPLVAQCHFGLGELHRRIKRRSDASGELARAMALFRELGMKSWAARSEAALRELAATA